MASSYSKVVAPTVNRIVDRTAQRPSCFPFTYPKIWRIYNHPSLLARRPGRVIGVAGCTPKAAFPQVPGGRDSLLPAGRLLSTTTLIHSSNLRSSSSQLLAHFLAHVEIVKFTTAESSADLITLIPVLSCNTINPTAVLQSISGSITHKLY